MSRKMRVVTVAIVSVVTLANGYVFATTYSKYQTTKKQNNLALATVTPKTNIKSSKQLSISNDKSGTQASVGSYKYEELDHSTQNTPGSQGQLVLAQEQQKNANYVLAVADGTNIAASNLSADWKAQLVGSDTIWQPASCASKPTYLIKGQYIFIDDGKAKPTDQYNSYLVFDMVSKKFRYFGGSDFTTQQGSKEHILSVANENDQIVFYIDPADTAGPLAGSSSFKHAAGSAASYVIRRVIDLSSMHYTDYKLNYTVPTNIPYYYVDPGSGTVAGAAKELVTLSDDNSATNYYYSGTVTNNQITFTQKNRTNNEGIVPTPPVDNTLDAKLTTAMPSFATGFDATAAGFSNKFTVSTLASQDTVKYLVTTQSWSSNGNLYENPVVYDTSSGFISPMTTTPTLMGFGGNYVPLGVF